MGVSVYSGVRVSGGTVTVHTGPCWLLALLVSHDQSAAQTVTVYDNTAGSGEVALRLTVWPTTNNPYYVKFVHPILLDVGLTVVAPTGVDVHVWAKGR